MTNLKHFEKVGLDSINESNETLLEIKEIFEKYPKKYFTQKMFVVGLTKSNPYVNKCLNRLVTEKFITYKKEGKTKFYINI